MAERWENDMWIRLGIGGWCHDYSTGGIDHGNQKHDIVAQNISKKVERERAWTRVNAAWTTIISRERPLIPVNDEPPKTKVFS